MANSLSGKKSTSKKPDWSTCGGLVLAALGIVGGLLLEGGQLADLVQLTAAMIVLGGTIGAVMVTTPLSALLRAAKKLPLVFLDQGDHSSALVDTILDYASRARKNGLVSLEQDVEQIPDSFLRKSLILAVDGADLQEIRKTMELTMFVEEQEGEDVVKVFEAAGGYAPTVGIIGAVLGLIQVMKHLENIEEVGRGIATAFVATVYGVGVANLFFLPAAGKLKAQLQSVMRQHELMLEGVGGIVEGLNPKMIRTKLEAFVHDAPIKQTSPGSTKMGAAA